MAVERGEVPKLLEIPRPYSIQSEIRFNGDALIIDRQVILSYKRDEHGDKQLYINRHKTVPITVIKSDGISIVFGFINPDNILEPFVTKSVGFRLDRPRILIGVRYLLAFESENLGILKFNLASTRQTKTLPASAHMNHRRLLEQIWGDRIPD